MTEIELNARMLKAFPEVTEIFEDYVGPYDGAATGCFLTHEDVLLPFLLSSLEQHDGSVLTRMGLYVEELLTLGDEYAENVATVGLIEGLKAEAGQGPREYLLSEGRRIFDEISF